MKKSVPSLYSPHLTLMAARMLFWKSWWFSSEPLVELLAIVVGAPQFTADWR